MNWRTKLKSQRELKSQGAGLLYQRVVLLVEIYRDQQFSEWCDGQEVNDVDELDKELEDVDIDFISLMKMLEIFPDEEQWRKRPLRILVAEALNIQPKPSREGVADRISWKDRALAAEKECERLRAMLDVANARLSQLEEALAIVSSGKRKMAEAMA